MATPSKIAGATAGERLTLALINLAARGQRTHCQDSELGHLWLSERPQEREVAARLCGGCPVELQCWDAARARDERFGVWGGNRPHSAPERQGGVMPYEVAVGLSRGEVAFQAWLNEHALRSIKIDGSHLAPEQVAYIAWLRAVADRIRSTSGPAFRTSEVIDTESEPSKVPEELTVRQASKDGFGLLPWGDHEIRCKIRRGEIPVLRRKPVIMLSRDVLIAWMISRDTERQAA